MARIKGISGNLNAFLDMLADSEIGARLLAVSDDGYNVDVGSTPLKPILFSTYYDHPRDHNAALNSDAAGRYQILSHWWDKYIDMLDLKDFSPISQDIYALQQLKECNAIPYIESGNLPEAVAKCAHIWASLTGAGYGQHENKLSFLQQAFIDAGGVIPGDSDDAG